MFEIKIQFKDPERKDVNVNAHCLNLNKQCLNIVTETGESITYKKDIVKSFVLSECRCL